MTAFWFFKRADESERGESWYYFRMAEPDFTLLPVYAAMQAYTRQTPTMYSGYFQEDHWAIRWSDGWQTGSDPAAVLGNYQTTARSGATASFAFSGSSLALVTHRGPDAGRIEVRLDGGAQRAYALRAAALARPILLSVAQGLPAGVHTVEITSLSGANSLDGFIVRSAPDRTALYLLAFATALGVFWLVARRRL
jgi:hypothetical protein